MRQRAGMLWDACYRSQKCLDAPLEPLRTHDNDKRHQSQVSILGGHTRHFSGLQLQSQKMSPKL